jgi:hypothetical protein
MMIEENRRKMYPGQDGLRQAPEGQARARGRITRRLRPGPGLG